MIPRYAPLGAHHLWREVYDTARAQYATIPFTGPGYSDADAELTADAALVGWYSRGRGRWRKRIHRGLTRMPRTGNLLNIGCFEWLHCVDDKGAITVHRFSPGDQVPLYWSEDLRACFVLPHLKLTECRYAPTAREAKLAKVWAKGRPATCSHKARNVPSPPLPKVEPGIAIAYISDKFTHGKPIEYIHHFHENVLCYFARPPAGHSSPVAIMVRGGNLRLTPDGLEG